MKVIITGGEGFIGKALAVTLEDRGHDVVIIDRKNGVDAKDFFDQATNLAEYDCVFHLAAQTSVYNTDHGLIIHDNVETFMSVCDVCRRSGVKLV